MTSDWSAVHGFYQQVQMRPEAPALWVDRESLTYGDLAEQASWIASRLRGAKRVCVFASRNRTAYAGILGSLWAGAAYVPVNPATPSARLAQLIELAEIDAVISDRAQLPDCLKRCTETLCMDPCKRPPFQPMSPPKSVGPSSGAYLVFTSGSTGVPKGVLISVLNLRSAMNALLSRFDYRDDDRFSQFSDLTFDLSVMDLFSAWHSGACSYVVPDSARLGPAAFIRKHQLTVWNSVPSSITIMNGMRMLDPESFATLRISIFGGEILTGKDARAWHRAAPNSLVFNQYGQTEAPIASLIHQVEDWGEDSIPIGRPTEGASVELIGPDDEFLSNDHVIGEIAIRGAHVASGYWRQPNLSSERFRTILHPTQGEHSWYCTGDLAFRDQKGCYRFAGRSDNQIKVAGQLVIIEQVEEQLGRLVKGEVAVVPFPFIDQRPQGLAAFIVDADAVQNDIRAALGTVLEPFLIPRPVIRLAQLPRTDNGKVDRYRLLARLENQDG